MVKSQLDVTSISSAQDLYNAAVTVWNSISQDTINSLIDSFDSRLTTCIKLGGNSLNGKRKLVKLYRDSIQDGNDYLKPNADGGISTQRIYSEVEGLLQQTKIARTNGNTSESIKLHRQSKYLQFVTKED